ncbi:PQQ-dependent sugar dehydrogenase [Sutcliffiella horikoshii]|uniref:PQQ-dependent sugar dehydrogenase n=1 Tax=Sutcliffiella horikoshii TaxID=79883 RepID=UPI001F3FC850
MKKKLFILILLILMLTACTLGNQSESENESKETNATPKEGVQETVFSASKREVLATNLQIPWSISKSEDSFYITERTGAIVKVDGEGMKKEEVILNEPLLVYGEGGLLGMALHPDFERNGLAFVYHTYGTEQEVKNRLVVIKYDQDKWIEQKVLLDEIEGAIFHNGGRVKIGPDNKLYATIGDANKPDLAQDSDTLPGSIIRMNLDGTVPSDNPYPNSYIYSFGHRNPQGVAWNEETGEMYASEHGPSAFDEINQIKKGKNYGWPKGTGDEHPEGMEAPLFHSGSQTWAPSGLVFKDGVLLVANLRGEMILEFELRFGKQATIWNQNGRIRDVFVDGNNLYFITNNTDGRGTPGPDDDQFIKLDISPE